MLQRKSKNCATPRKLQSIKIALLLRRHNVKMLLNNPIMIMLYVLQKYYFKTARQGRKREFDHDAAINKRLPDSPRETKANATL
jgi:hypothetical protein